MALKTINDTNLIAIADAIRAKGVEGTFKPSEMAGAIAGIQSGGGGGTFIPSTFDKREESKSSYGVANKVAYSYSSTAKNLYFTYSFPDGTPKEYRLALIVYTSSGQTTRVKVYFNDTTTEAGSFSNSYYNQAEMKFVNVPTGTTKIKCTVDLPQYNNCYAEIYLIDDLESSFTSTTELIEKLIPFSGNNPLSLYNGYSPSIVDANVQTILISDPKYTLITEGGVTLDGGEIVKDFRGVITNANS